jgi:hypothetical protein
VEGLTAVVGISFIELTADAFEINAAFNGFPQWTPDASRSSQRKRLPVR